MSIVLSCPSCSTRYRADPQAIGANGRRVRCASCGYVWTAEVDDPNELPTLEPAPVDAAAEMDATPEIEEPKPVHTAYRERQAKKRQKMSAAMAGTAWGGLATACALLFAATWFFRVDIVTLWPQASSAYAAIGSEVNPYGISVGELDVHHEVDQGVPLLVIEGSVHNYDRRSRALPGLRAVLRDEQSHTLLEWTVSLDEGPVSAGEVRAFRTIVSDPPPSTVEVEVTLIDPITAHLEDAGHGEAEAEDYHDDTVAQASDETHHDAGHH